MLANELPPLDKVDPAQAWKPWEPDDKDPWGPKWASHLYRRAAFGANRAELKAAQKDGLAATLDLILKGQAGADKTYETVLLPAGAAFAKRDQSNARFMGRVEPTEMRGWWLYCMLHGGHPLREKMTLFWHNHFATSIAKVGFALPMLNQNKLIREHALGKFHPFLLAMSKDAAMLKWLDSNSNVKGAPNENYAREVMELFSLGVGNYTEKDVREAARAFTGWHTDGDAFDFNARYHDDGEKTVLGQTGKWDGGDVVEILLKQKACASFLVGKLYRYFISETEAPPAALLEPLAEQLRKSDYDVGATVRTLLSSRHFFSDYAFRQRIKDPVEFVLGAARAVYAKMDGGDYRDLPQQVLVGRLTTMGQALFSPPNVKGWPGGKTWLNTSTMLARDNFAQAVAMGTLWGGGGGPRNRFDAIDLEAAELEALQAQEDAKKSQTEKRKQPERPEEPAPAKAFDPARLVHEEKVSEPKDVVRVLLDLYLPGGISPSAQAKLTAFVAEGKPDSKALDRRVREAVHAIMTMPEYQLA
jgi:uncharacterized protein (DUF1800 family)